MKKNAFRIPKVQTQFVELESVQMTGSKTEWNATSPRAQKLVHRRCKLLIQNMILLLFVLGCQNADEIQSLNSTTERLVTDKSIQFDWPNLYGSEYTGVSRETDVISNWKGSGPKTLWRKKIGKGYSAPIIVGEKLVIAYRVDDEEIVECLNAQTGKTIWKHSYPTDFVCSYEYSDGPYSTATANQSSVYFVSGQGTFYSFDLNNGEIKWQRDLLKEYEVELKEWPVTCSPLLLNDRLIFNLGASDKGAGIVALDAIDGSTIWEATEHHWSHGTPCVASIHGSTFVFVPTREGLVSLTPDSGKVHWELRHQTRRVACYNAVSPVVWQDLVCFVTGPNTGIRCLKIQPDGSYTEPWKNRRLLDSQYTNLLVADGFLFGFMSAGQGGPDYKCIDIRNGKLRWKKKPDIGRGTQLAFGNTLLILGESGTLMTAELNSNEFIQKSMTTEPLLTKPCYTSPSLANGLLYLRNEIELICIDFRRQNADAADTSEAPTASQN